MAALLGSFALGYVPVQIPASLIARKVGEKLVILINLVANGTLCLMAPMLARRGGPSALYVCLALMGIFQGCRVPCNAAMDARWLPDGPERCASLSLQCMPYTCSSLVHPSLIYQVRTPARYCCPAAVMYHDIAG